MGELALTDNVPQEQPEASGRGADCWGTCEELLLVSAVRRHGTSNWNLIASELKDRAISLSVCPVYFSEEACKQKYDSLRGRYGSSTSTSRDDDTGNNMHWFEELRKLRVAHLKRELELYDGSIGSLQVKIKRLKAEKAQDMLLSKQAGITVAKAQSNDSLLVTMSHETHVSSSPSDEGSVMDHMVHSSKTLSSLPLEKPMVPENGEVDEQGPNLLPAPSPEQVTCEDQQVHDSAEEVKGTSPIVADMTVGVDDSSQQSGEIHNMEVETTEQPSVLGTSTDESKPGAELHNVAHSVPQEGENAFVSSIAELDSKQKDGLLEESVEPAVGGHEAVRTEFLSADEDTEMLQSEDVEQDLDAEVLPQGSSGNDMILAQVEGTSLPAASELDSVRDKDADDELLAASEQIDVPDAEPVASSPPCLSVTTVKPEDVGTTQPEAVMLDDSGEKLTDGKHHGNLSNEQDKMEDPPCIVLSGTESVDEVPEATSSNGGLKSEENVELDLDVAREGPEKQSDTVVLCDGGHLEVADGHSVDVGVGSEETLAEIHLIPEQWADLTHEIVHHVEEVGTCQSKHVSTLTVEEDLVDGNLAIPDVAKEVVDLDMRDDEVAENLADVHSNDAMSPSDVELVPIEASVDTEVDGFKEGTVINGDKHEELENNSFVYPPHSVMLGLAADGPDVQIIIALDEPNDVLPNIKSKTILTSGDVGGESVNQLSISTQSKLTYGVEDVAISRDGPEPVEKVAADLGSTSIIAVSPEILPGDKSLHLKAGLTESNPTPSQLNAMELLKMVYSSVHDMPPESSILPEEVAAEPPVASVSPVPPPVPVPDSSNILPEVPAPPPVPVPDSSNILPEVPAQENTLLEVAMETCNEQPKVSELDGEAEKSRHSQESASLAGEVKESQETLPTDDRDDHSDVEKFQPEAVDLSGASSDLHVLSPPVKELSQEETLQQSTTDQSVEDVAHGQEEIGQVANLQSQTLQFSAGDEVGNTEQEKEIIQMTVDTKLETSKDDLLEVPVIEPLALVKVNAESNEDVGSPDMPVNEPDWSEATTKVGIEGEHDSLRSTPITVKIVDMEKKPEETDSSQERKDSKEKVYLPVKTVEHRPGSPVESIIGDLESKGISTSHEGSDSVHEQYKHGSDEYGEEEEGRQGTHDYGESQVDKSEAGSPGDGNDDLSSLSRRNRRDSKISRKLFPLLECLQNIYSDKKAKIFKGRPEIQDRRYDLLIRRHMDLTTVRGRLEEGVYSGSREFFRDLLLIFNNALVYYPSESSEFSAAKALRAEATQGMERIFRMEALLNQDGPATGTRESKKPKSGEGGVPIVSGSPALVGGSVTGVLATAVASSLDKASRKRSGSRVPIAVETSCSETLVDSEAAGARSGSANVVNVPSSGRAGEAAESQEDEEVNGRFKDTKSLHKGGSGRGKVPREELLEGLLSKNASNKGLGRVKLRGMKVDDSKKSGAPYRAVGSKIKEEREDTEKKKGKERDEIGDNDLLRKGKSLTKLKDRDVMREREGESKAVPTRKAPSAPRPPSNSHDTISQTVVRPARGVRKPVNSTKEPARVPEQQPKKRARK